MSKRQQPNHRAENSRRPQVGFQRNEKNIAPGGKLRLAAASPFTKIYNNSVKMDITQSRKYMNELKDKLYKINKGHRFLDLDRRIHVAFVNMFCDISTIPLYCLPIHRKSNKKSTTYFKLGYSYSKRVCY